MRRADTNNAGYYQRLHDTSEGYRNNNWLVGERRLLELVSGKTVVEVGCGNARFLREAARVARSVHGIDWATSPCVTALPANATFQSADLLKASIQGADVCCSGDVLEHFPEPELGALIERLLRAAPVQYHVIACYDDRHSHLTVRDPDWWLRRFREAGNREFRLERRERKPRRVFGRRRRVAVISSGPD